MQKLSQNSLSARVYAHLRASLIGGDFLPDQRLTMQDLALALGTSVTPVREAALRLVSENALEIRSGRFIHVPQMTMRRYGQIRLLRSTLEPMAAALAVEHVQSSDIAELRQLHAAFQTAEASGQQVLARRLNQQFHFYLYQLCDNEMLLAQIEALWASMGPILNCYYGLADAEYTGAAEHDALIDALVRRDAVAAAQAIVNDIDRGAKRILRQFGADDAGLDLRAPAGA